MYKSEVIGKGNISAKIVTDSIAHNGRRITTFELRYHRYIHSEFMTHRVFSRNASSSRAIPVKTMLDQVANDPATPIHWGKNQGGMQAREELEDGSEFWNAAAVFASTAAEEMMEHGYHKQITNRLIEPFQFIKVVLTSTEMSNWYHLRDHPDAQPEIHELASLMLNAASLSTPEELKIGEWHLPYIHIKDGKYYNNLIDGEYSNELELSDAIKCSVARCARVSYMNHDKSNPSVDGDIELYSMLAVRPYVDKRGNTFAENDPVHLSPLEHQASPLRVTTDQSRTIWPNGVTHMDRDGELWSGNFKNWIQYRQTV